MHPDGLPYGPRLLAGTTRTIFVPTVPTQAGANAPAKPASTQHQPSTNQPYLASLRLYPALLCHAAPIHRRSKTIAAPPPSVSKRAASRPHRARAQHLTACWVLDYHIRGACHTYVMSGRHSRIRSPRARTCYIFVSRTPHSRVFELRGTRKMILDGLDRTRKAHSK